MTRLERSLRLLCCVNAMRFRKATMGRGWRRDNEAALRMMTVALRDHDADARARVDARQLTIWDAIAKHPP